MRTEAGVEHSVAGPFSPRSRDRVPSNTRPRLSETAVPPTVPTVAEVHEEVIGVVPGRFVKTRVRTVRSSHSARAGRRRDPSSQGSQRQDLRPIGLILLRRSICALR